MFLCDVPVGSIICFGNIANYFIKVKGCDGISGVVNLGTGKFYTAKDLRQLNINPNHLYYVARNLDKLYQEDEK